MSPQLSSQWSLAVAVALWAAGSGAAAAVTPFTAQGANAAAIATTVGDFRTGLGTNNGVGVCAGGCLPGVGRREINWDAVPDAFASPNAFPGNFFNLPGGSAAGRIRGARFTTVGSFEVSATLASGVPILFGNHHAANPTEFADFSAQRIFGLVGSNQLDVSFSLPGQPATSAVVRGFGAVFTDVDLAASTRIEFFGVGGGLLYTLDAPPFAAAGDKSFSFAGVVFDTPVVQRVRITSGGYDLNRLLFGANDAVAMDDFIYGEPALAVPEPAAMALWAAGLLGLVAATRRRRPPCARRTAAR